MKGYFAQFGNVSRRYFGVALACALMLTMAGASLATDPTIAYDTLVNGAKTEMLSGVTLTGPIVFGILGIFTAIGWAWMRFKRGTKSS